MSYRAHVLISTKQNQWSIVINIILLNSTCKWGNRVPRAVALTQRRTMSHSAPSSVILKNGGLIPCIFLDSLVHNSHCWKGRVLLQGRGRREREHWEMRGSPNRVPIAPNYFICIFSYRYRLVFHTCTDNTNAQRHQFKNATVGRWRRQCFSMLF